jgi:hypothetical protein
MVKDTYKKFFLTKIVKGIFKGLKTMLQKSKIHLKELNQLPDRVISLSLINKLIEVKNLIITTSFNINEKSS